MSKVFKDFFWNLATSLLVKFPDLSNKYNLEPIFLYYSNFVIPEVIHIKSTLEEKVFKIMENIEISKLPGRFLKLVKFTACPSLMEYFLILAKLQNSNLFSRKAKKLTHLTTGLSRERNLVKET